MLLNHTYVQNVTLETKQCKKSWSISILYTFTLFFFVPLCIGSLFQTPSSAFYSYWNHPSSSTPPPVSSLWFSFLSSLLTLQVAPRLTAQQTPRALSGTAETQHCTIRSWTAFTLSKSRRSSRRSISNFLWRCFTTTLHCKRIARRLQRWVRSKWRGNNAVGMTLIVDEQPSKLNEKQHKARLHWIECLVFPFHHDFHRQPPQSKSTGVWEICWHLAGEEKRGRNSRSFC